MNAAYYVFLNYSFQLPDVLDHFPGGTIVIVMREEYLSYVTEYVDKLEPLMKAYEDKGYWKEVKFSNRDSRIPR